MNTKQLSHSPNKRSQGATPDELGVGEMLALLWERRKVVFGCTLGAVLLTGIYVWLAEPIYQVDAMLQVETKRARHNNPSLATLTEGVFELTTEAKAEVEILQSNLLLGRAAENLHLDVIAKPGKNYKFKEVLKLRNFSNEKADIGTFNTTALGKSFILEKFGEQEYLLKDDQGEFIAKGSIGKPLQAQFKQHALNLTVNTLSGQNGQIFTLKKNETSDTVSAIKENLVVTEKGLQTNIINLSYQSPDPGKGALVLNSILDNYIKESIDRRAQETSKTLAFIQEQMPVLKRNLEEAEEKLNSYRASSGAVDLGEESRVLLNQSVGVETQIVSLRQRKDELLRTFNGSADMVATLDQQMSRLQSQNKRLESSLRSLPRRQQDVVRLTRNVQVNQELYTSMMNNVQQLQVAKAGELGNARIVDRAIASASPVKPQKAKVLGIAAAIGLVIGAAIALVRKVTERGVDNPQVIEKRLGIPVLTTIPHSAAQAQQSRKVSQGDAMPSLLALGEGDDLAIENLRALRTRLQIFMKEAESKVILFAGPSPRTGNSFLVANLAILLAKGSARVLVIDGDLYKGNLHRLFGGMQRDKGLSDILASKLSWQSVIKGAQEKVSLITTGVLPNNPADLLMSPRLGQFLKEASSCFDYILMDAPPLLAVTDATIIGAHVGAAILTLKAGKHSLEEVHAAIQRMEDCAMPLRGCLLNDVAALQDRRHGAQRYAYALKAGN